jgi:DNA-directed RNA polymerase subunit RPC12/RpoP
MGKEKGGGIGNFKNSVMPPQPGQTGHYVCGGCGERFTHKIPLVFNLGVKCPKCGSFRVSKDPAVVY